MFIGPRASRPLFWWGTEMLTIDITVWNNIHTCILLCNFNFLPLERWSCNLEITTYKLILRIGIFSISCRMALMWFTADQDFCCHMASLGVNDLKVKGPVTLQWRHNGSDGVSNHQPHDCLFNRLFSHRSKKTSKLRVTGLCAGNSPVTGEFPAQTASNHSRGAYSSA